MEDSEIISRVVSGNTRAYDHLVDRYYQMVYAVAYRMTGNAVDADELSHDAFVDAYLKIHQLKQPERFGGWLRTLTLNLGRMWIRRRRVLQTLPLDEGLLTVHEDKDHTFEHMYFGMLCLSAAHRMILALHYFEGLSYIDIACFLGVPKGTVMSRLSRARKLLKEELDTMSGSDDFHDVADLRFKEEIQSEVALLLSMRGIKSGVGTRLNAVFENAPERFSRLLDATESDSLWHNIAVIMPRLGSHAFEVIFTEAFSPNEQRAEHAQAVLREYITRCVPDAVPGADQEMASIDVYILVDQLMKSNIDNRRQLDVLWLCAECSKNKPTLALLVSLMVCLSGSFKLLWDSYTSKQGASTWVRHALTRYGNLFLQKISVLLLSDEVESIHLGLVGLETIAKSTKHDWIIGASSTKIANERRIADRYPAIFQDELDEELMVSMVRRVAEISTHSDAFLRGLSIRVLSALNAEQCIPQIREGLRDDVVSVRLIAIHAVAEMDDTSCAEILMKVSTDGLSEERVASIDALGQMSLVEAVPHLISLTTDVDGAVRASAIASLGAMNHPEAKDALKELMASGEPQSMKLAAKAFYGGVVTKIVEPTDLQRRLAEKRRKTPKPISYLSLDAAIRFALTENRPYDERELTERIACICEDYCGVRRYLVDFRLMTRVDAIYQFTSIGELVWNVEHSIIDGMKKRIPVKSGGSGES